MFKGGKLYIIIYRVNFEDWGHHVMVMNLKNSLIIIAFIVSLSQIPHNLGKLLLSAAWGTPPPSWSKNGLLSFWSLLVVSGIYKFLIRTFSLKWDIFLFGIKHFWYIQEHKFVWIWSLITDFPMKTIIRSFLICIGRAIFLRDNGWSSVLLFILE